MQSIVIDNLLMAALIKSIGNILTAAVPSLVTYLIGRKVFKEKKLLKELRLAYSDLQFLLQVEIHHCQEHKVTSEQSLKLKIRNSVKHESDCNWSGKNTLSRLSKKLEQTNV